MKLIYSVEIKDEISEIEVLHNDLDLVMFNEEFSILKSTLESDGETVEITEHDSKQR